MCQVGDDMEEPRLTVITPVFNGQDNIEACLENVIAQGCSGVEHLVVDGGSTDATVQVLRRYAGRYQHIRWVSEKDRGQSDAMNKGLRMARGKVVSFLNVDDFYEPDTLSFVTERFRSLPDLSLLVGNCRVVGEDGGTLWINRPANLEVTHLLTASESKYPFPVNPSAYFYHRSIHDLVGEFSVDEHYCMDIDFMLKAVQVANTVHVDRILGNYRYVAGTKTFDAAADGTGDAGFKKMIRAYRKRLSFAQRVQVRRLQGDIILEKILRKVRL